MAQASSPLLVKTTRSSQSAKELNEPEPKLSTMFFEIKNEIFGHQQAKEVVSSDLLTEDAEILKKLDIPWIPDDEQDPTADRPFDSDKENLQKTVRQYKQQMSYMQEVNDGLMMANRRLREDLQDVNDHFQELTAVSKEALK